MPIRSTASGARNRLKALTLFATIAYVSGAASVAYDRTPTTSKWDKVRDAIHAAIESGRVPGAIVAVRKNGKLEFIEAQGSDDGFGLKKDTVIWTASMTKPIVATAVLMLVEAHKIELSDGVAKYIPEFAKSAQVRVFKPGALAVPATPGAPAVDPEASLVPAERPITVRDLLTMTSGLQTIGVPNKAIPAVTADDTLASFTAKLGDAPLDFQPGSRWAYSNATGHEVLARIVEVASGRSFAQFVQQRIFTPLKMKDSSFGVRKDLADRTAPLGMMAKSPLPAGKFASGSAGIWTTAEDYSLFAQMLLNGGSLNGQRLLKPSTVAQMTSNQIGDLWIPGAGPSGYVGLADKPTNHGLKYGFSVAIVTDGSLTGHAVPNGSYGWDGVGTRRFWVIPSENVVLVMLLPSVKPAGTGDEIHKSIESAVLEAVH
jgi:CubicO group peptidase (beta-lactamase class C family)